MAALTPLSRRAWLVATAASALWSAAPRPTRAQPSTARIGLIDLALREGALDDLEGVSVRQLSLWASGYRRAAKQSREHKKDHAEVMARALVGAFRALAPEAELELFVATPVLQRSDGAQVMDLNQLAFAFDWFAAHGVRIVALTFVGRDTPALAEAMSHARRHGLVILASAGNGPDQNPVPAYPAAYPGIVAIGTTALAAERQAEERVLRAASLSRAGYVDYAVRAPLLSRMDLRNDPEAAALLGSSRATAVAGGLLAALATRRAIGTVDEAQAALDALALPADPDLAARGVIDIEAAEQRWRWGRDAPGVAPA
jgi:hypothetical protein